MDQANLRSELSRVNDHFRGVTKMVCYSYERNRRYWDKERD